MQFSTRGTMLPDDPAVACTPDQASLITGLNKRTLEALRQKGDGPPYFKAGEKLVRYRRGDLDAWVSARMRTNTAAA